MFVLCQDRERWSNVYTIADEGAVQERIYVLVLPTGLLRKKKFFVIVEDVSEDRGI